MTAAHTTPTSVATEAAPGLQPLRPHGIPAALRERPRWAPWCAVWRERRGKYDKVPAWGLSTNQPEKWRSFDAALSAFRLAPTAFAGLGLVMTGAEDLVGIDLDRCVDERGGIAPWAEDLVRRAGSYAEISPSGKGLRIFVRGRVPQDWADHAVGIEVYSGHAARFLTVTGVALDGCPADLCDAPPGFLDWLQATYPPPRSTKVAEPPQGMPGLLDPPPDLAGLTLPARVQEFLTGGVDGCDRSRELFSAAVNLRKAGLTEDEALSVLAANPHAMEVALDHRRQDHDRALQYLWQEHVLKARAKAAPGTATVDDFDDVSEQAAPQIGAPTVHPTVLDWAALPADPPDIRFVIPGWLPEQTVTLFAAHGGTGKSYLSLYIAICIALGRHPFQTGAKIERARVMLYSAEDNMVVMQARLARYLAMLGVSAGELAGWLEVLDATECENVLFAGEEKAGGRTTKRFAWIAERVLAGGVGVLIFDNASDAYDASEIDRAKVRQFMSSLRRLAPTVLLLAHVDAVSSMADPALAKGYSGSTAWHNSARSRWFMARATDGDDIVLSLPKTNYAQAGAEVVIRWDTQHRVFTVVSSRQGRAKASDNRLVLLGLLRQVTEVEGLRVSPALTSQNSLLNLVKDRPECPRGLKPADVSREVGRWMAEGLATVEVYTQTNRTTANKLVLTDRGRLLIHGAGVLDGASAEDLR